MAEVNRNESLHLVISDLNVSNRVVNALRNGGIRTVEALVDQDAWDLHDLRGFGAECMNQTVNALAELGLTLKPSNYFDRH